MPVARSRLAKGAESICLNGILASDSWLLASNVNIIRVMSPITVYARTATLRRTGAPLGLGSQEPEARSQNTTLRVVWVSHLKRAIGFA